VHGREETSPEGAANGPAAGAARRAPVLCIQHQEHAEIERLLAALDTPLKHCVSGHEAIRIARAMALSCVITPLHLPDMSAATLIESLHDAARGLAVIVIVDNPAVSEAVTVMRCGAHAVVDSRILSTGLFHHLVPLLSDH
jgi:DNA-binding NtrC family response regulator